MQCVGGCLFDAYERKMRLSGTWGDTAFLHGLACASGVDVVIIQESGDYLVGSSLMGNDDTFLIPVVLVNDFHFWACEPLEIQPQITVNVDETVGLMDRVSVDQDSEEAMYGFGRKTLSCHDKKIIHCSFSQVEVDSQHMDLSLVHKDVVVCEALASWSPWELPSEDVTDALRLIF